MAQVVKIHTANRSVKQQQAEKFSVQCYMSNNSSYGLAPHNPSTAVWYGYATSGPSYAGPNTSGVEAGTFVAEKATWTGVTGISVYDCPDNAQMLVLLVMMPFSGINVSRVAVYPKTKAVNKDLVKEVWNDDSKGASVTFQATLPDGKPHTLVLSSIIEQGTVVNARFTFDDVTSRVNMAVSKL